MKNLYIADLHFGHEAIIPLDRRPFASAPAMDAELVRRWNAAAAPGDTVYILGDFCWGDEGEWMKILAQLRGSKVLLRGNHDPAAMSGALEAEFQDIRDILTVRDGPYTAVLCHYPLMFYPDDRAPDTVMLCGHVHLTPQNDYLTQWRAQIRGNKKEGRGSFGNIVNVGCMLPYMDYTPRTLEEILRAVPPWGQGYMTGNMR